ncbi:MAG: DeoR/GlpR family DNA-binding transcription regulator [Bacilli bacterium]
MLYLRYQEIRLSDYKVGVNMLPEERKLRICAQLNERGKVNVVALSEAFQVTTETIRRDLALLEKEGVLQRVYGGAVKQHYTDGEPVFYARQKIARSTKIMLGRVAASHIAANQTIFLDHGTTVEAMIPFLPVSVKNTYVTTSVPIALALCEWVTAHHSQSEVFLCGGQLNVTQFSVGGAAVADLLRTYHFDLAFLTIGGFGMEHGFTDYHHDEAYVSRLVAGRTQQCVVVADSSKMGVVASHTVASFRQVDVFVTDASCPSGWANDVERSGMQWVCVEKTEE